MFSFNILLPILYYIVNLYRFILFVLFCRNPFTNGQTTVTKIRAVSHIRTPHRGVAYCPKTGRRDSTTAFRDQSNSR